MIRFQIYIYEKCTIFLSMEVGIKIWKLQTMISNLFSWTCVKFVEIFTELKIWDLMDLDPNRTWCFIPGGEVAGQKSVLTSKTAALYSLSNAQIIKQYFSCRKKNHSWMDLKQDLKLKTILFLSSFQGQVNTEGHFNH